LSGANFAERHHSDFCSSGTRRNEVVDSFEWIFCLSQTSFSASMPQTANVTQADAQTRNVFLPSLFSRKRDASEDSALAGRTGRPACRPLLDAIPEQMELSPLEQMTDEERLVADFHGSGMSTGPHPMTYCREALSKLEVKRACDLSRLPDGQYTRVAGCVIARQRPGRPKASSF